MNLNRLTQFHEDPTIINWWHTRMNKALSWLSPARRRALLAAGAIYVGIHKSLSSMAEAQGFPLSHGWLGPVSLVLTVFGILWLIYQATLRFNSLPTIVRHHPQLSLHLLYWGLILIVWNTVPAAGLWREVLLGVALIFPFLIWRCGYMLFSGQNGRAVGTRFSDHLIYLLPFYGGTETPYGKGLDYLSKFEAKTEEDLARSQLAGIKLLILGGLWGLTGSVMDAVLYGPGNNLTLALGGHTIGIPKLAYLVSKGADAPVYASWASIYCELVREVLRLAVHGHRVIGLLRLFGFNVFRNTYKPLLAESVHDFWNRYYYYFKELLVNFFFMPVFMQSGGVFRMWPRLRLFVAVFAAACIGNTYYHLLKAVNGPVAPSIGHVAYSFSSQLFYSFLLAGGIYVSMLRKERRNGKPISTAFTSRITRIFGVWTFFSVIYIWDVLSVASFSSRTNFFLNLFGLA